MLEGSSFQSFGAVIEKALTHVCEGIEKGESEKDREGRIKPLYALWRTKKMRTYFNRENDGS